jgi:hypothetical protein
VLSVAADAGPDTARASLLEPVPIDSSPARRGRWWFVVVPLAAIVLLVAVGWRYVPSHTDPVPKLPRISPPVALPEIAPPSAGLGPAGPTASPSASRRPSASPAAPPAPGAGHGQPTVLESTASAPPPVTGDQVVGLGGRCVEPAGGGSADGTQIRLAVCNGAGYQRWIRPGDGTARTLGKCLDVAGGGTANRTPVTLYECNGTGAQQWQFRADSTWRNPQSNRCLDAEDNSSAPGTRLIIWDCSGDANQRWAYG